MSAKVTYTKAIKNGKLKATEMELGASVTGTLVGYKEGKYGNNIILNVGGIEVEVFPAGNLKYLSEKAQEGDDLVITRTESVQTKNGYTASRFDIAVSGQANVAVPTVAPAAAQQTVKEKLDAIKANRGAN